MADSDKNILITPSVGASAEPTIKFTGFSASFINLRVLDDATLSFEGTAGQLFSISDGLSGTIFSVNDISGIPSIEVLDTGEVILAEYDGNVGIGTASPTSKLYVSGSVTANQFIGSLDWTDVINKPDPTITLGGDLSGSVTLTDLGNATLNATVSDDSHNHIISNVDGLQTALNDKAPLASPALSGTPTAPTAASGTNTTQIATTAFVTTAIDNAGGGSGTVTSVAMTVPTGLSLSGSPITSSGTFDISLSSGYIIPTTASLDAKAPLDSPTFTGIPTAPTASVVVDGNQIATLTYVNALLSEIDGGTPTSTYELIIDGGSPTSTY